MSSILYYIICALLIAGVLTGIYLMSKVKTAAMGNLLSCLCMALAIILTLFNYKIISDKLLWISMAIGAIIGILWILRVKMIQMPQLVAIYNGFGGAASAIIAMLILSAPSALSVFSKTTAQLALITGMVTFFGSIVAAMKLSNIISQKPITLKGHQFITIFSLVLAFLMLILSFVFDLPPVILISIIAVLSSFFGVIFSIRIGGADMPITISLLNSLSGVAGSIAGMAVGDLLLVSIGGIIGASGLFLTQIMCKAMNRSLASILLGKTSLASNNAIKEKEENVDEAIQVKDPLEVLREAKKVVIIPGYGMALSQSQFEVKKLVDLLESKNIKVDFAIHPVAGRMPGHMNIILCEADIPYDKLNDMDSINPVLESYDVALIIGANDVINPAAREAEGTPIYGMPIINADKAKHVIICNYDLKPGYSGVDNPLYKKKDGVSLLLGDAKETIAKLVKDIG
ncbi:MAG: NAD(P)(+) transhydrogenase (Re/Si-specific) subunit beta [Actinomycetota bacterium]|nr:NAD(P)(+) transhydrogenase (Re/Si-specific) subunit beta [Actinomycetota bacterium]